MSGCDMVAISIIINYYVIYMAKRGTTLAQHVKSKKSRKTKKRLDIKHAGLQERAAKRNFKKSK
jgi:hypothetical protein